MTRQTTEPISSVSLNQTHRMAFEVARLATKGTIDINPPYQRGTVWNTDQRIALVRSWLMGVPIPPVILNNRGNSGWKDANGSSPYETGKGVWAVIDGKQRIETAMAWFGGELAVPASWFPARDVAETVDTEDGHYVRFTDLTDSAQAKFEFHSPLGCAEGQLHTVQAEAEVYLLVNGQGTPQTDADMDNARAVAEGVE